MFIADCYNSLIYPIILVIYIILFCFFFVKKIETIIFIALFVLTFFLALKIYLDIFYFSAKNIFTIKQKSFCFNFIKKNSIFFIISQYFNMFPAYIYLFISIIITIIALLIILVIFTASKKSGTNNEDTLIMTMSKLNGKKLKRFKIIFIFDIVFLSISACILNYFESSYFCINDGKNVVNNLLIFSSGSGIILSSYLLKMASDFFGIENQIADGSG